MTRRRTLLTAAVLLFLPPALLGLVAQAGVFSGRVTSAESGRPLTSATVTAHDLSGVPVATMTTDAAGTFTTPPLAAGVYYAKASAGPDYRDELYRDIACALGCDVRVGERISIQSNLARPGVDFTLSPLPGTRNSRAQSQPQPPSPVQPPAPPPPATAASPATTPAPALGAQPRFGRAAPRAAPMTPPDTPSPILVLPRAVTAVAASPSGATVALEASAISGGTSIPARCEPASGSTFPIGTTLVHCSASDAQGHIANGSFTVVVIPPAVDGRLRGDGRIVAGDQHHHVTLNLVRRGLRSEGSLFNDDIATGTNRNTPPDRFRATLLTRVYLFDTPDSAPGTTPPSGIDQAVVSGLGTWNGESGFTFEAVVVDAGEPGAGLDTMTLTIRRPDGSVVLRVSGRLTAGNIESY